MPKAYLISANQEVNNQKGNAVVRDIRIIEGA